MNLHGKVRALSGGNLVFVGLSKHPISHSQVDDRVSHSSHDCAQEVLANSLI